MCTSTAGIGIALDQTAYLFTESDGVVQVCAVIESGGLENRVADVLLVTQTVTATDTGTAIHALKYYLSSSTYLPMHVLPP